MRERDRTLPTHTSRQQRFHALWEATGFARDKQRECMIEAGYSKTTPASVVIKSMRQKLQRAMLRQGGTPIFLAKKHLDLLDAKSPAHPDQPDNSSQLKALDMAYNIFEVYPPKKVDITKHEESVTLEMKTIETIKRVTGEDITIEAQARAEGRTVHEVEYERADDPL